MPRPKIVTKIAEETTLRSLRYGETFEYDERFMIKTDETLRTILTSARVERGPLDHDRKEQILCTSLATGQVFMMDPSVVVTPVQAEITISVPLNQEEES